MPRIKVTSSEYGDIVAAFLYDKLINPDAVIPNLNNPEFDGLMEIMNRKGMRAVLMHYWLSMDPQMRVKYRLIQNTFRPSKPGSTTMIEINWEQAVEYAPGEEPGFITRAIRKVGKVLKKFLTGGFDK
jgi:hypothetical protein